MFNESFRYRVYSTTTMEIISIIIYFAVIFFAQDTYFNYIEHVALGGSECNYNILKVGKEWVTIEIGIFYMQIFSSMLCIAIT
jgi:hypothetical protein